MKRRKAREYVLQFIYAWEIKHNIKKTYDSQMVQKELEEFWSRNGERDLELMSFANEIIKGTLREVHQIDSLIKKYATKWDIDRMINIDRNILRFAIYEILYRHDIPFQVTINEAVEIAKKYSTKESASFINGILDRIAKDNMKSPPQ